jgi:ABC-type Fe3+ transport system permease subunit
MSESSTSSTSSGSTTADPPPRAGGKARGGVVGIIVVVVGLIMVLAGAVTFVMVQATLADQNITVAEDADFLAGDDVDGPFSAYAEAMIIGDHAEEIGEGKTYAELDREDPRRATVMDAAFLQASLFTSVVAFGVALLVIVLGLVLVMLGLTVRSIGRAAAGRP